MREGFYQKDPNTVSRKIGDEVILVPIQRRLADLNAIFLLRDPVSVRVWELIDGSRNLQQIQQLICREFEADADRVEKDLIRFLSQLKRIGAISSGQTPKIDP